MKILAFDTSSKTLSLAILEDDQLLGEVTLNIKKNHSISLMPAIDFLVASLDLKASDLDRIVVAKGPGSYTGLRVAVATAKMLAYSLSIDLVGLSSLQSLAVSYKDQSAYLVPIMDARRKNVYAGFYQEGQAVRDEEHIAITELCAKLSQTENVVFLGEVDAFQEDIKALLPNAKFQASLPSAYGLGKLAVHLQAEDVHAFEPNYLKKVEAEENWLKNNQEANSSDYIKRV
ncbi:tRNA (adenosine(37)-N6)-threonylcarbamoyltransferase complex dimerization subunit type 1 TsaB [Streptococcus iniae]|uniref:tRNA (adenosine(37)-N6)-threonylcarbamoyltransferase complex dimerization subunit type 1 TsaB n=1 Tax=Streptococcus iniae TaxID=1346 RepID=UPI000EF7DE68|nr:tRNA (adenosine(37)-N6)-threonylcarbamoyltransferase complex dimerization subunit type 1 TsaB [Streptococcus iniae]RLV05381.1 tRNA (adenosine(37)-N6)-threonylcarbamoyltransferase complex dimerization subunit type 1 TsaB [Streptococcus iniae]